MGLKFVFTSLFSILGAGAAAQNIKNANQLFKAGKFGAARQEYAAVLANNPNNTEALIYMGYTSLLQNNTHEAIGWLTKARDIHPKQTTVHQFLAEAYYRQKDFKNAVPCFMAAGRKHMANKLASFKDQTPYETGRQFDSVRIPFLITSPLPFLTVVINGQHSGNFIIDTGGGELILDTDFAKESGAEIFGYEGGSEFGGGKKTGITHGKITDITLGSLTLKHLPINIMPMRQISLAGLKIDGVIGTVFLYQFLSTMDYKNGCLILRNKDNFSFSNILRETNKPHVVPFVMAGDHFMLSHGAVNKSDTMLLFIDTGLAGSAFTCPRSTLKALNIPVQKKDKTTGQGGGGTFDMYPFHIDSIRLGSVCVEKLNGLYGPFPPQIENSFGFSINGLLSHEFFKHHSLTIDFSKMKYIIGE